MKQTNMTTNHFKCQSVINLPGVEKIQTWMSLVGSRPMTKKLFPVSL